MAQLKMIFDAETTPLQAIELADGFELRTIQDEDLPWYNILRTSVNFDEWSLEKLSAFRNKALTDGMFVAVEKATGILAASACAEITDMPELPDLGVLGWVMTSPEKGGFHLGRSVSVAAMHRLYAAGYRAFSLKTDDFRKAALKTYLRLGWRPWLYLEDMEERWRNIAAEFGLDYDKLGSVPEKFPIPPMVKN